MKFQNSVCLYEFYLSNGVAASTLESTDVMCISGKSESHYRRVRSRKKNQLLRSGLYARLDQPKCACILARILLYAAQLQNAMTSQFALHFHSLSSLNFHFDITLFLLASPEPPSPSEFFKFFTPRRHIICGNCR